MTRGIWSRMTRGERIAAGPPQFWIKPIKKCKINYTLKKTISWYIVHLIMVLLIAFFITHKLSIAATIASAELLTETFIFYIHEKVWNKIKAKGA